MLPAPPKPLNHPALGLLALLLLGCGSDGDSGSNAEPGPTGGTGSATVSSGGTGPTAGGAAGASSVVPPVPRGNCTDVTISGIETNRWTQWSTPDSIHVLSLVSDNNQVDALIDTIDLTQVDVPPSRRECGLWEYNGVFAVTGSPSGAILLDAISDNLEFPGYRNDNLLIGHLDSPEFQEVVTPWTEPEAVVMSIRWDGEAFVVITYTAEGQLAASRFSEAGENLTPLTLIGPGINTGAYEMADVAVDTATGFIALVDRALDGIQLVAFGRDLTPAREGGMLFGVLEPSPEEPIASESFVNSVALRPDSVLALYMVYAADKVSLRHRAQRFGLDLTPVGPNIELPPRSPSWTTRQYRYQSVAAAWHEGFWYVAASSSAGIMLFLLDDEDIVSEQLLVSNDSYSCAETTDCPMDTFPMRQLGFTEAGGRLWLHFYDISDYEGATSNYRTVEASPDCMHLSARDKALWGQ